MSEASQVTTADEPTATASVAAEQAGGPRASRAPWFILLLLLLIAAGAGYYWVSIVFRAEQAVLEAELAALRQAQADVSGTLERRGAELAEIGDAQSAFEARVDGIERTQMDLMDSVKSLFAKDKQVTLDWILAETEYLIFAAVQRLALERDARGASAALSAADARIKTARHPDLLGLREQLTADIAALDAVAEPDIEGLALYLSEAVTRVDELPTKPIAAVDTSFRRMRDEDVSTSNWTGVARALWRDLVGLVEIKNDQLTDDVLFDPQLRDLLAQNLRLELASARLAVLRRDVENFRAAARLIDDLLVKYYDGTDGSVRALSAKLAEASAIDLDPDLPDISASLDAVRALRADSGVAAAP
ncbi:MAG: uroporphyrinogen-III C-methyltransferase [Gammaproteobacteria bacterium]